MNIYIEKILGPLITQSYSSDLLETYKDSNNKSPILILTSKGCDPMN
jgi:hypothetical protein